MKMHPPPPARFHKPLTRMRGLYANVCSTSTVSLRSTGSIPSTELSHVCRNMGEKLTEEEVNSIMLNAPDDGMGGIEYGQFATQVAAMASK